MDNISGFSEQAADQVMQHLGVARKVSTAGMPIGGGAGMPRSLQERSALAAEMARQPGLAPGRISDLLARYGTRARSYLATLSTEKETPLPDCPDYTAEEILHICRTERVVTVDDILCRRTLISLTGRETAGLRESVGQLLGFVANI